MSQWYYAVGKQQNGPVSAGELVALHGDGRIDASTLVWREGLPNWQPLSALAVEIGIPPPKPAPPPAPASDPVPDPPPAAPSAPQAAIAPAREEPVDTPYAPPRTAPANYDRPAAAGPVVQAGFLRRFAALIIDSLLIGVSLLVVLFIGALALGVFAAGSRDMEAFGVMIQAAYYLLYFIAAPIYYAGMESSARQATLGKLAIGIKVCDAQGRRLSFVHALGRWAAAALSYLSFYIGFLMAAFTEKKQALHDLIAGTLVVDKWAYTDFPERQRSGAAGCLVIGLVLLLPLIVLLGILAAIAIPAYSDYTARARVSEAYFAASVVKLEVSEFALDRGRCPQGWEELGMRAPENRYVRGMEIGADEAGQCVIQITLTAIEGLPAAQGRRLWLTQEADASWSCSTELPARILPPSCR